MTNFSTVTKKCYNAMMNNIYISISSRKNPIACRIFPNGYYEKMYFNIKQECAIYLFCVVLLCVFKFWVPCCDVRYDFRIQTVFGSSLPPVFFVEGSCLIYVMFGSSLPPFFVEYSCLIYVICVCWRIVVSNTIYCVVVFVKFVLCILCCQFHCVVHFDCPFGIL